MKNTKIEPSLIDQMRAFNFSSVIQTVKDAKIDWPIAGIFFGSGFLTGFLFKRYYKMFIICVSVGLVLIWGLDHFFHIIDWKTINNFIGDSPATQVDSFFVTASSWIVHNVAFSVSFCIGAVLGVFI